MIWVFVFFGIGTALNAWRHAAGVVNSKLNGITTYGQYLAINGADQAWKSFGALCFLIYWLFHQSDIVALVQILWPSLLGTVPSWLLSVLIVTPPTAGAFGLSWDVLADLVLIFLRKKYPQLSRDVPPTVSSTVQKEIDAEPSKP
jgi:hypothetical protein